MSLFFDIGHKRQQLNHMQRWLFLFWGICRGQKKPEDIPYSMGLFWILLFLGITLDTVNLQITYPAVESGWAIVTIVSHTVIYYSCLALFLYLMGFSNRINQTVNSILGCGLIIGLMATPLYLIIASSTEAPGFQVILLLVLNIWMLFIIAHILRHALSVGFPVAFILSIGFFMLNILIGDWFLPEITSGMAIETGRQN